MKDLSGIKEVKKLKTKIALIALTFFIILTLSGTVTAAESDLNNELVLTDSSPSNNVTNNISVGATGGNFPDPYNTRTMESFTTIQEAIDDTDTMNGDTIWIQPGVYNENVVLNKNLTLIPWPSMPGTVTINAGGTGSCIRVTPTGSGSTIQGLILTGATQSSTAGVHLEQTAHYCNILQNTMTNNWAGMWIWSNFNQIYDNNIIENLNHGIRLVSYAANNNIYSNIIKNNNLNNAGNGGGITSSTAARENNNLYLNQIVGNHRLQIDWNSNNLLNANNNWWGTNSGPLGIGGTGVVTRNYWLVLGINANPYSINNGQSSTITADLTHNFDGIWYGDISGLGHVKDGIPINFIFTGSPLGTLSINPAYTLNGIATTIFTASSLGISQINATLDSANVHTASDVAHTPCDIVIVSLPAYVNVTKTVTGSVNYWNLITFHITAHNNGPGNADGVQVRDLLPAGLTYVSSTPSGTTTYDDASGIWDIGTLIFGGTDATLDIVANVTQTGIIVNWANVTAQTNPDSQPFNTTSLTLNVPPATIVELTKEFRATLNGPAITTANYLDTVYSVIKLEIKGPDTSYTIHLTDIPNGYTLGNNFWVSFTNPDPSSWISMNHPFNGYTLINFPTGSTVWTGLIGTVTKTGRINNTAIVDHQDTYTPVPGLATAYLDVPDLAHVTLTKTVTPNTTPNYWQLVTFTITAHNNGPSAAEGVQVKDLLPSGLTYVSSTPSGTSTYDHTTGIWDIGTLLFGGADATLDIVANVTGTGTIINWANVTAQTTYDSQPFNTTSLTLNVPPAAIISIDKYFTQYLGWNVINSANYLSNVYAVVHVTNNGPNTVNVVIQDIFEGLTQSYYQFGNDRIYFWLSNGYGWYGGNLNPIGCSYDRWNGHFTINNFEPGGSRWLSIYTQVTATGQVNNTANEIWQDIYRPGNWPSGRAHLNVAQAAHVTLTKTTSSTTPNYWQLVTFTITAHNNGPNDAEGVEVKDLLPAGLTWVSDDGLGAYDHTTGIWNIGTLIYGGIDAVLHITANVTNTGSIVNWANVTAQTTYDSQPFNTTSLTLNVPDAAALELTKTVSNINPVVHDTILYTLIVQNHGPNAATSVNVYDVLPLGGLTFVRVDSVDYGSYANGVWTIDNLPANTVAHLVLRFTVERAGTIENRATLTSLTWDPELYPHTSSVIINARNPPVQPSTTVNAQEVQETVGMQKTGMPMAAFALALVMLVSGILYSRREQ